LRKWRKDAQAPYLRRKCVLSLKEHSLFPDEIAVEHAAEPQTVRSLHTWLKKTHKKSMTGT
jgi:hypothetical protein